MWAARVSVPEIARAVGCCEGTVWSYTKNLPRRVDPRVIASAEVFESFWASGLTNRQIADALGYRTGDSVRDRAVRLGLPPRLGAQVAIPEQVLVALRGAGVTFKKIAETFGVSCGNLRNRMSKIRRRDRATTREQSAVRP